MPNKLTADRSQLDDDERKIVEDVESVGWHVIAIEEDEEGPGFAYTIGLHHSFGHPEVIVFGLRTETLFQIVNTIGEAVKDGTKFEADHESGDVLNDYLVHFRAIDRRHYNEYLGYAQWFYNGDGFPALQCVWPDSEGHYPWHPDIDAKLAERSQSSVTRLTGHSMRERTARPSRRGRCSKGIRSCSFPTTKTAIGSSSVEQRTLRKMVESSP